MTLIQKIMKVEKIMKQQVRIVTLIERLKFFKFNMEEADDMTCRERELFLKEIDLLRLENELAKISIKSNHISLRCMKPCRHLTGRTYL